MSDLNRKSKSAARNVKKIKNKIEAIKNSDLSAEEKQKALKSFKKMVVTTTIVGVVVALLLAAAVLIGLAIGGDKGVIFLTVSMVVAIGLLIGYALLAKAMLFKDFQMYYDIVDNGFDGLDEQEIKKLKPNSREKALIKKYKAKSILSVFVLLLVLGIEFYIIMKLELPLDSPILYIITIIIIFIWVGYEDKCRAEIHRIKSGRYKRNFGFRCKNCKATMLIEFSEIEKYMDAPTNEYGIRVAPCHNCNNLIPLYDLEVYYDDYKKHLEQIQ